MSQRIQDTIVILVTCLWAQQGGDPVVQAATDILCQDLRRKLTGERPSDRYFRQVTKLADLIIEKGYPGMSDIAQADILFSYSKKAPTKEPILVQ